MPLYKITERRLKRKERDEEDGLAGLKAALREELGGGGDETDDEESESDTDSDDDGESDGSSEDEDEAGEGSGTEAQDPDDEEESDLQPIDLDDESDESDEDEEEEEDLGPAPMSISEALTKPIYPGTKRRTKRQGKCSRCVLCPGKTLQGEKIVDEHLASSLHKRAVTRYQARLDSSDPIMTEDPRELVADIFEKLRKTPKTKAKKEETSDTPNPKSTKSPTSKSPNQPKVKKTKAERKAIRAQKLLERRDKAVEKEEAEGEVKLNRQARRLLALQEKGTDGKSVSETKGISLDGEKEEKKEKKNKKSRKARKSLLEDKVEEGGGKGVAEDKAVRKEKRQKNIV